MITIRKAEKEDIDAIYEIDKASVPIPWSKNSIEEELLNMLAKIIVAVENEEVIGFAICWFVMDECHIGNIVVSPNCRHQGIGKKMLEALLEGTKEHMTNYITLEVRVTNSIAISLYEKFGFKEVCVRKHYYKNPDGTYEDALIMSKDLY